MRKKKNRNLKFQNSGGDKAFGDLVAGQNWPVVRA
jgi:hypothetical protein